MLVMDFAVAWLQIYLVLQPTSQITQKFNKVFFLLPLREIWLETRYNVFITKFSHYAAIWDCVFYVCLRQFLSKLNASIQMAVFLKNKNHRNKTRKTLSKRNGFGEFSFESKKDRVYG